MSNESRKHGIIDHVKHIQKVSLKKWKNREYDMQQNKYVEHQDMKIYCATNQFPGLNFLGTYNKLHGVRGLVKRSHISLIPNYYIAHVKYVASLVLILFETIALANPSFQVLQHSNTRIINPSNISHTDLCYYPLTTGTLLNCYIR